MARRALLTRKTIGMMIAAAVVGVGALWFLAPEQELSPDPIPDPLEPELLVKQADVVFRWTIPSDRTPVYVEILQAIEDVRSPGEPALRRVWASEPLRRGLLRLPVDVRLPAGPLYWRPVGVSETGEYRQGDTMTFEIYW
ncbi:hypothetical protein ABI59_13295 [Acidobacteria bacterium Mor1]|nr:hypothetical protein ABI59_13295 [Acidobacteria bacterium Mor1]